MPELPEVETIRRELEREVVGKKIKTVEVSGTRTVRRQTKKQFIAALEGTKFTGVSRRGKFLVMNLDSEEQLVVHLRMSGQLLRATAKAEMDKHTHVVITFTQSGQLRFVDPRTFGEMFVAHPDQMDEVAPELGTLGMDPVELRRRNLLRHDEMPYKKPPLAEAEIEYADRVLGGMQMSEQTTINRETLSSRVALRLRDEILAGELKPGERLNEIGIAERYGVSRTPLREALKELVRSRLAITVPYRGVFVRQVSFDFAREVYEMRAGLDGIAGFHAATRATRSELRRLGEVCARIASLSEPVEDPDEQQERRNEILLLNMQFHRIVAEMAHNGVLLEKHDELWSSVSLVRQSVWRTGARTESSLEEHEEILDALTRRDAELARDLCERHVEKAWSFVSEAARARPVNDAMVVASG